MVLASYGFYGGGAFGDLLNSWEQMGVFSYMLPFLLVFALVYGIFTKLHLFGDSRDKSINAIIALAVALMSLQFNIVPVFFADILPRLGIALAGILVMVILLGLFGNPNNKALNNTLMWGSFGVGILIILQSTELFQGGTDLLGFIPREWVPWIAIIALIAILVGSARTSSDEQTDSHFVRGLGGGRNS